ncbi:MAG: methyltransferase domain-containing protein [Sphingomonadales bacterium]
MSEQAPPAKLSQDQVATLYDRMSGAYDIWSALTESRARRRALALADIRDGQNLLEVAVGTGAAFAEIVARNPGGRNLGIDISEGMLAKAKLRLRKKRLTNFELRHCSAFEIPVPGDSFDTVFNAYMFDLLPAEDWPLVLAEFHRVLKPGGQLVLYGMTIGEKPGSGLYQFLSGVSPKLMGGCRSVMMAAPVKAAGFDLRSRDYCQQMLFPTEVILATKPREAASISAPPVSED